MHYRLLTLAVLAALVSLHDLQEECITYVTPEGDRLVCGAEALHVPHRAQ